MKSFNFKNSEKIKVILCTACIAAGGVFLGSLAIYGISHDTDINEFNNRLAQIGLKDDIRVDSKKVTESLDVEYFLSISATFEQDYQAHKDSYMMYTADLFCLSKLAEQPKYKNVNSVTYTFYVGNHLADSFTVFASDCYAQTR